MLCVVGDKETVRDILLEAKTRRGMKYARIAERIPTDPQNITNFMRGKVGKPSWLDDIDKAAAAMRVPVERLQAAIENTFADEEHHQNVSAVLPSSPDMRSVPVYQFVPASRLGGPEDFYGDQMQEEPERMMVAATSAECMVIVLDGDCMAPEFPHGAKMLVDRVPVANEGLRVGDCYFIQARGEDRGRNTFKRYAGKSKGGTHLFECINPKYRGKIKIAGEFDAMRAMYRIL